MKQIERIEKTENILKFKCRWMLFADNKWWLFTVNFSIHDNLLGNLYSTFNELKINFGNDFTHFCNILIKTFVLLKYLFIKSK